MPDSRREGREHPAVALNTTMSIARDTWIPFAAAASRYQPSRRASKLLYTADGWYDAVWGFAFRSSRPQRGRSVKPFFGTPKKFGENIVPIFSKTCFLEDAPRFERGTC